MGAEAAGAAELLLIGEGQPVPLELTSRRCLGQTAGSEALFWRTEDLAADGAVQSYLCMANGLCAFPHGCFRLIQLPAMMLRCRFALMNCARLCAGFLTHLIFLSLPRPGDPCPPCGREQGFEVEQAGEVTGERATEQW